MNSRDRDLAVRAPVATGASAVSVRPGTGGQRSGGPRFIASLAALAATTVTLAAGAPAAFASTSRGPGGSAGTAPVNLPPLPPGWNKHPPLPAHAHALATGGMPGWQGTLIVAAAVLLAALAVTAYRMRATRRRVTATPA